MQTSLAPVVTLKNGITFANSRDVADFFGKLHKNVLRDIDALLESAPTIALNFEPSAAEVKVGFGTRMGRTYDMTKDGFTLLAMGFTGDKALRFKLAYIAAFNEMERRVLAPALPDFSNPVIAARAWADEYEQKQCLQIENKRLAPLAQIGERAVEHDHSIHRFCRTLPGVNTMTVKRDLLAHNYLYQKGGTYRVYARFLDLFVERIDEQTGQVEIFPTAAGRARLIQMYETDRLTMKNGQRPTAARHRLSA